ncbi:Sulfofructose kinase [Bordetella sputigena]|uniref:PfkB family carbohydrate kinase n=1 Tax=Bordetella sputigena TaxID=1416810 RepID=UPI0039F06B17
MKAEAMPSDIGAIRAPSLICLGLSAFDLTWVVDRLLPGGKARAGEHHEGGGGMAANAAVAAARLGASVRFWGRAGDDLAGRAMRQELADLGVDVSDFRLFEHARSSVSGILVDAEGERTIVNFRGEGLPDDAAWLPLRHVAGSDAVLADPRWPDGACALFARARELGVPSVLDGDVADAAIFDRLLPLTDFAVFSEPGLAGYAAGMDDVGARLAYARRRGCRVAAVTLGARGMAWDAGEGTRHMPARKVRPVDTTGAGDVFHGALAYGLALRWPMEDAFRFSAAAAACKCLHRGGRSGAPDLQTAWTFLHRSEE